MRAKAIRCGKAELNSERTKEIKSLENCYHGWITEAPTHGPKVSGDPWKGKIYLNES
ncbi:hypothetical protein EXN66_Car001987 [Channa argus]|uniref:Uncharacterized protein n=1 Tax=Channa argus TaxID=215402 RepID=A0A6G1P7S7_CHAAH|nr:hypothetical protein EXN66_Car001987 [Channa argus]